MVPVGPGTNISLKFGEDGNVSGFIDGCRGYSGRYTTMGETIRVTNLTEVYKGACPLSGDGGDRNTAFRSCKSPPLMSMKHLVFRVL
jgi:hypothetical protein